MRSTTSCAPWDGARTARFLRAPRQPPPRHILRGGGLIQGVHMKPRLPVHLVAHRNMPRWLPEWNARMVEVYTMGEGYEPPEADQCPVPLQRFLYLLMRDFIPPGYVEGLMMQSTNETAAKITGFTNTDLANYAAKLGRQLTFEDPA